MWKQIVGFEHYEINEYGQVRSWRKKPRTWRSPDKQIGWADEPKLLKGTVTDKGYVFYILREKDGSIKRCSAHRLVATTFLGPPSDPLLTDVAHNDGNPKNNHVSNLRWSTHRDNQMDMRQHGTMQDGEKSCTAKLKLEDVLFIRSYCLQNGRGAQRRMVEKFNISPSQVNRILKGERWASIA